MGILRFVDRPIASGSQVDIEWEEAGAPPRAARVELNAQPPKHDDEDLRWYLEDYLQYPADPAPAIAARVEGRLADLGHSLFEQLFYSSPDATKLWASAAADLAGTRFEIFTEPGSRLPWELLRDPRNGASVAVAADAFVRSYPRSTTAPRLPEPSKTVRVLLVIARPAGAADVPFRSVASHLIRLSPEARQAFELDVLRPPTIAALRERLDAADRAGRPYHVVHFDGHGAYLDENQARSLTRSASSEVGAGPAAFSLLSPLRTGAHGYLVFETGGIDQGRMLVDGPALGEILRTGGVSVLLLNACRSAHTAIVTRPDESATVQDAHSRVRAYGSFAEEVMDVGLAGVVAMRYNVFVVTAATFVGALYSSLAAGQSLGAAVTSARRQLAADPYREVTLSPRPLQDWMVPVVYEAAPVRLVEPREDGTADLKLALDAASGAQERAHLDPGLPADPEVGFFGRDETLLSLDRAFDSHQVVLMHSWAGGGKTSTAAEFARWYRLTGGLNNPSDQGKVLFTSFAEYCPLGKALDELADAFGPELRARNERWDTLEEPAKRNVAIQLLAQVPTLWIWDNVESVVGLSGEGPTLYRQDEQAELAAFLGAVAGNTVARVLLTSRRDEQQWLGDLPARVRLPDMPMLERLQLARAISAARGRQLVEVQDWLPLLEFSQGNPLTVTVLVNHVFRNGLLSRAQIIEFVEQLRSGTEAEGDEEGEGTSRSLAASLSHGLEATFSNTERAHLPLLALFQGAVQARAFLAVWERQSDSDFIWQDAAELHRAEELLDQAADAGLLIRRRLGHYQLHPAVPAHLRPEFASRYGSGDDSESARLTRSYIGAIAQLARYSVNMWERDRRASTEFLALEEANLLRARRLAKELRWWDAAVDTTRALSQMYERAGRTIELTALVDELVPAVTDPATGGARHGAERAWGFLTNLRQNLALGRRDWPEAERLSGLLLQDCRNRAAEALAKDAASLTAEDKNAIRSLRLALDARGDVLRRGQESRECVVLYEEAYQLAVRIGDKVGQMNVSLRLGNTYFELGEDDDDLGRGQYWYQQMLSVLDENDRLGRASAWGQLGLIAFRRFEQAQRRNEAHSVLEEHWKAASAALQEDLRLAPPDAVEHLAVTNMNLGALYAKVSNAIEKVKHYNQQAIRLFERANRPLQAAAVRINLAEALWRAGRADEALEWARAGLRGYQNAGPADAGRVKQVADFVRALESKVGHR
jgi:tetratricopeptide (TPR) repeat protein